MIDFNTNSLILFCYPSYAGGKFLINSLGLSDQAVFQDAILAQKQLDGNLTKDDKIQYLLEKLSDMKDKWSDLNLGCANLFGVDNLKYENLSYIPEESFNYIIHRLSTGTHKFFLVSHSLVCLDRYLSLWKNARVVMFENCRSFIDARTPVSLETEKALDCYQQDIQKYKAQDNIIFWDNNLYFNQDKTIGQIKKLYDQLGLNDFNEEYVTKYYELWMRKLTEIK